MSYAAVGGMTSLQPPKSENWKMPELFLPSETTRDEDVVGFLNEHGISYRERLVNDGRFDHNGEPLPPEVSSASLPALNWNGRMVTRLDVERLKKVLRDHGVSFEDS